MNRRVKRSPENLFVRKAVCLSLALLLLLGPAFTQARTFTPVGETNGLEARVVTSLVMDRDGFLWVGSHEGLFRYDGYRAQAFLPQRGNPGAISDIEIRSVYEAADGIIWVGTNTGGLVRYDPATGLFRYYRHDAADPTSLADDSINAIAEGPSEKLWVATKKGLERFDRTSGQFEHFRFDSAAPGSLSHDHASSLLRGKSGTLWIGTMGGGVNRWNPATQNFSRFDLAALTGGSARRNHVLAMYEDGQGSLWAGTREGLVRLDTEEGSAEIIGLGEEDGFPPVVTSLSPGQSDRLWLTTMNMGLFVIDCLSGEWRRMGSNRQSAPGQLPPDALTSLSVGAGHVFVGTWGDGVYRMPLGEEDFKVFNMNNTTGLTNNVISAVMAAGQSGQLWLGSFGGGPQKMDIADNEVKAKPLRRHQMREAGVLSLAGPIDGRLYAATTQGLYEFTDDGMQVALFEHDPGIEHGIGAGTVTTLLRAGDSGLWVGMGGSGLYFFDTQKQLFTRFGQDSGGAGSLKGGFITALLEEPGGYLWVGTRSNGLNRCHIRDAVCEHYPGVAEGRNDLSHHNVTTIFRDRRDRVWVGTDGGGLSQVLQDQSGTVEGFEHWGSGEGLLNDGVMAIQEDLDESLWLSTRNGLSRLNPATGNVINFAQASGLPVSHFSSNAASADDRNIYFGSTGGLLVIPKGTLLTERRPPNVRITSVKQAEPGQPWQVAERTNGSLRMPFERVLAIELAVLDYVESSNEYAFRLSPSDPWTGLGPQRQILFQGLAPGQYEFQARGRDAYGKWGESDVLHLEVVPPFWMTTWFRALVLIAVILLVYSAFRARQATLKRRSGELLRLSEKREHALEEQLGSAAELAVLTPRQKEILQLLAEGQSTRDIAGLLGVSIKTVEAHRSNLMERLEIYDLPGLVRLAVRSHLVSMED